MLLQNKIVLIAGIGPGLGAKLAVEAAREGAAGLLLASRTPEKLDAAEAAVRASGAHAAVLKCRTDIGDAAQCARLVAAGVERFGRIDALVNSAYQFGLPDHVSSADLDGWPGVFGTNLLGTLRLTQSVLPAMKAQGGGSIVMINTMAAREVPPVGGAAYAASKAALGNAVKYLAKEVGVDHIRVNSVYLGFMWGEPTRAYFEQQSQALGVPVDTLRKRVENGIPLRRIPTDDECARAALFLVSDYASAVTGASLDVNGGAYMP